MNKLVINTMAGLVLSLVAVILSLLAAEGATRLYDSYFAKSRVSQAEYDWGSRLEGYSIEKRPGVFRILVLGDSIAYGQGVKRTKTFSKQLENLLNENSGGERFEVINTGFCGIDTSKELRILLNTNPVPITPESIWTDYPGLAYQPDLILLQYTVENDAEYYGPGAREPHPPIDGGTG